MPITILSSREFNQDTSRATKAAKKGPVYITNRGRRTHVLLSVEEYDKLSTGGKSIIELLRMPDDTPRFDFDPPRMGNIAREIDLS